MYREGERFYLEHRGKHLFHFWLRKARYQRHLTTIVHERLLRVQRNTLRSCFRQWRSLVTEEKDQRQLDEQALDHYHRLLKRRVLLSWHNEMIQQISRDNENQIKLHQYLDGKHHQLIELIYLRWKNVTDERRRDQILCLRADRHFEEKLLRKTFDIWKEENDFYRRIRVKHRCLTDEFHVASLGLVDGTTGSLVRSNANDQSYFCFMETTMARGTTFSRTKTSSPSFLGVAITTTGKINLLFDFIKNSSVCLQCFVQWLIYLTERKRKKMRYNEATHRRHGQLLQDCLRQFLIYTDHTRQRRQALFIHQQVYVKFS